MSLMLKTEKCLARAFNSVQQGDVTLPVLQTITVTRRTLCNKERVSC